MKVLVGVDIGQSVDPTAIAVVEQEWRTRPADAVSGLPRKPLDHYNVRYLQRLGLGIPYPQIAMALKDLVDKVMARVHAGTLEHVAGELVPADFPSITTYMDATGVGQPVVDILMAAGTRVVGVYFTHGDRRVVTIDEDTGITRVTLGKAYMVARLQALLQTRRLHIPRTNEAEVLSHELLNYQIRVDQNANDKYGAFKVGTHDDLVTALGLCVQEPAKVIQSAASTEGFNPSEMPEWAGGFIVGGNGRSALDQRIRLSPGQQMGLGGVMDDYRRYS